MPNLDPRRRRPRSPSTTEIRDAVEREPEDRGVRGPPLRHPADRRHRAADRPVGAPRRRPGRAAPPPRRRGPRWATAPCRGRRPRRPSSSGTRTRSTRAERHASLQNDDDVLFQLNGDPHAAVVQPCGLPRLPPARSGRRSTSTTGRRRRIRSWCASKPLGRSGRAHSSRSWRMSRRARSAARQQLRAADDGWFEAESARCPRASTADRSIGGSVEPVTDLVTVVDA